MAAENPVTINIGSKRFDDHLILDSLEFEIQRGEFLSLVGPSGCGKSTLLNIVAGLITEYEGEVGLFFPDNGTVPGMVFQEPRLMPWLTVAQNVGLVQAEPDSNAVERMLQQVGLAEFGNHFPLQLSGGMQRRVALARAFVTQPSLMLMDEPFVSLDQPAADQLRALLIDLRRTLETTILFVTHNLAEALMLSDRILFLSGSPGRVILNYICGGSTDALSLAGEQDALLSEYPKLLSGIAG